MKNNAFIVLCGLLMAGSGQLACKKETAVAAIPAVNTPDKPVVRAKVLLTDAEITGLRLRKGQYTKFIDGITAKLAYQPTPVAELALDPHYTDTGVSTTGDNAKLLAADALMAYRAGFCYLLTEDVRYAATAQRIIDAWATTLKKVSTDQSKADINFNLPYLIMAASWVREANQWSSGPFDAFLQDVVLPVSQAPKLGNHGLWGVLMESSAAAYLGDAPLLIKARKRWEVVMKDEVSADGSMPQEMERSATSNWRGGPDKGIKGMAYTHYALMPASIAAKIFANQGQPIWQNEGGELLKSAYNKAAAWTLRPETFPYYASNNGKLQGVRDAAYFVLLLPYYPNKDAEAVVAQGNLGLNGFMLVEMFGKP